MKIVIADDETITRIGLRRLVEKAGHEVIGEASDGFDAINLCKNHNPDLILMDIEMSNLDGLRAAKLITKEKLAGGVILISSLSSPEYIDKAKNAEVYGYLIKPIDEKSLIPTLEISFSKSQQVKSLEERLDKANQKLEDRKIIEKAKGILMKDEGLSEEEAYNKIRKLSMDKSCSRRAICEAISINYE